MRILIDMVHPADVNFYKRSVEILGRDHEITITVMGRGRLPDIVRKEYDGVSVIPLGTHRKGMAGKLIGLVDREVAFFSLFSKERYDRVTSFGFYPAIAAKPFGIHSVLFTDDIEYNLTFELITRFGDDVLIPDSLGHRSGKVRTYSGFKELAYIYHFQPVSSALEEYGVEPDRFVFVRETAGVSLNYLHLENTPLRPLFKELVEKGYKILYYAESKDQDDGYRDICTIVTEPVDEILSLLYHARFVLTSGDTIAREAALLGTPTVYFGRRTMKVNAPLLKMGAILEARTLGDIRKCAGRLLGEGGRTSLRRRVRDRIEGEWDDTTEVIVSALKRPRGGRSLR